MERTTLTPKPFPEAEAPYAQGVKISGAGALIFVAAQVAFDERKQVVGSGDPAAQTHQVIRNLQRVLAQADASLADVAKVTVFITDAAYFQAVAETRAEYFKDPLPASSFAVVSALSRPELLVAMEAIAVTEG